MTNKQSKPILFRGGTVVLPDRTIRAALVVEDGKVAGLLSHPGDTGGFEVVDVSGKLLFPGVVDTHVHMWDPSPLNHREDWHHGTRAAAAGGITTVVDMPLSVPPVTDRTGFENKRRVADANAFVDYAMWGGLTPGCVDNLTELDALGCVAYKGFMSFANPDYPQITDGYLVKGMRIAAAFDGLIGVHAENAEVADFGSREMAERFMADEALYDDARPWWCELEAIQRAVLFAENTGARLYICHMTVVQGAQFLKEAKMKGSRVHVETCPHYLVFDRTALREKKSYAKCNPPLRSRENVDRLWDYVRDGTIETLGSDHGPYTDDEKTREGSFWKELCGFGGYDAMLPAMLTEGWRRREVDLSTLSRLMAGNAARIMGLTDKGSLLPGCDADLAVIDPEAEWTYDGTKSFSKTKSSHNIYQGMTMRGRVEQTWVRGVPVYRDGSITGRAGYGRFVPKHK